MPRCLLVVSFIFLTISAYAQDASTGAIRGTVSDSAGRRIVDASIALVDDAQGFRYFVTSDSEGEFVFELLPPGEYSARAVARTCLHNSRPSCTSPWARLLSLNSSCKSAE